MQLNRFAVTALCLMLTGSPVLAKEKKHEKPMDEKAMMELWQKAATPGEPHKLFATLAGSWTTQTKEWMEPGKPPSESTGSADMKMLLDGRFLYQEYNSQMMGQPFSGVGIDGYDNITKKYVTAWIDTMGTGIFFMEGTASPDGKTSTTDGPFAETKEQLGGFLMIDVPDLNDAIRIAAQFPAARFGSVEVRPMKELGCAD